MRNTAILFFACTQVMLAAPPEPQPYTTPPPPGLPIGSEIWVLAVIGLVFSFYKLKPLLKHKKTPM